MVVDAEVDTTKVEIINVALVPPAATVMDAGTVAVDVSLLDKETVAPPVGAALPNVTVPWELFPPITLVGISVTELSDGGITVRVSV
jgi:hypothetical protein